jgi:hypothetical protein
MQPMPSLPSMPPMPPQPEGGPDPFDQNRTVVVDKMVIPSAARGDKG